MIYFLLKHPKAYAAVVAEIDSRDREGRLSKFVTYAEARDMPYLQAVMKEAMRLHPAVGIAIPRYVPRGGVEIEGVWCPEGTVVGINAWVVHHDKAVFGDTADEFIPERWLEDEEKAKVMERSMYQVSNIVRFPTQIVMEYADLGQVWWWKSCLHWKEPVAAGDE